MRLRTGLFFIAMMLLTSSLLANHCVVRVLSSEQNRSGVTFQVENLSAAGRMPARFALRLPFARFETEPVKAVRIGEILKITAETAEYAFDCRHFEVAPATRDISNGHIHEIILAGEDADPDIQGMMTVRHNDGSLRSFIVHKYTLILVKSLSGGLYAGRLHQLKAGWKCSVAYDVPDDDDNYDFAGKDANHLPKIADNMIVDYALPKRQGTPAR
ncbi:MAG: hypothetical protein CVV42_17435 [Candidatus Riflebacteria bacterium HGW-Riflebacteria-2]|jgi:hypothetical protein|nr:MAG: hypothetical protein CVV42_17435 [Candidatus Riflebacteria bacterium HGW-Riflebacteria-2]